MTEEAFDRVIAVNLKGTFLVNQVTICQKYSDLLITIVIAALLYNCNRGIKQMNVFVFSFYSDLLKLAFSIVSDL